MSRSSQRAPLLAAPLAAMARSSPAVRPWIQKSMWKLVYGVASRRTADPGTMRAVDEDGVMGEDRRAIAVVHDPSLAPACTGGGG